MSIFQTPSQRFRNKINGSDYYSALAIFIQDRLDRDWVKQTMLRAYQKLIEAKNETEAEKLLTAFQNEFPIDKPALEEFSQAKIFEFPGEPLVFSVANLVEESGLDASASQLGVNRDELERALQKYHVTTTESKKSGNGILYWGGFLMVIAIWPLFAQPLSPGEGITFENFDHSRMVASSSVFMQGLHVSGGVISFVLCFFWYRLQELRDQRSGFPRAIGKTLFVVGTLLLVIALGTGGQQEVLEVMTGHVQDATTSALLAIIPGLVMALILLALAYLLQFKRRAKSE